MKFKVGDKVYSFLRKEYGEVIRIDKDSEYPVIVRYPKVDHSYTKNGFFRISEKKEDGYIVHSLDEKIKKILTI